MASAIAKKWTAIDRLIQYLRYKQVLPFIGKGCVVADLGCGDGDFLRFIKSQVRVAYGIDSNIESKHEDNIVFIKTPIDKNIPIDDGAIEVITALAVLEHLDNPYKFASEIYRLLKKNGICTLTTPSPQSKKLLEFLAFKLKIISEQDIKDHKKYYTKDDLLSLFSRFDFDEIIVKHFQLGMNTLIILRK